MIDEYKEGIAYSEDVRNAVRYGYQYRKEAEVNYPSFHFCLHDASDVLLWLGNAILGGIVFDKLKDLAKKALEWLKGKETKIDEETETVLENEGEMKVFYEYVREFSEHRMSITEEQRQYIKEEIMADFGAAKESEIYTKEGRMATIEERKVIYREAISYSEKLTMKKNETSK